MTFTRADRSRRPQDLRALVAAALALLAAGLLVGSAAGAAAPTAAAKFVRASAPSRSTHAPGPNRRARAARAAAEAAAKHASTSYYVSLGDSYAAGYQPTSAHHGHTDRHGFAYQIVGLARAKGYHFTLENFGCGGATTKSILKSKGCKQLGPGGVHYPGKTQAAAAESFLRAHRGQVGLITVSIGGNDVTKCTTAPDALTCVEKAVTSINTNLAILLPGLRAAAGASVPIVGTTYPDVILGLELSTNATEQNLAKLSQVAFKDVINPALEKQYSAVNGTLVDVTAATGAYGPMTDTTDLPPYGTIPVPVAEVCDLTYFCQYHNIHPKTAGYTAIAKLVVGTLPDLRGAS